MSWKGEEKEIEFKSFASNVLWGRQHSNWEEHENDHKYKYVLIQSEGIDGLKLRKGLQVHWILKEKQSIFRRSLC